MSDEANAAETANAQMAVLSQYVRELTFVNDAAKAGVNPSGKPNINVQVNVDAATLAETRYLVSLRTNVSATTDGADVFHVNLDYVGAFHIANVPEQALQPVLLIEAPRLLFPFARRIVAEATRDGGYPPLLLDPIDFTALYRQQLAQAQANAAVSEPSA